MARNFTRAAVKFSGPAKALELAEFAADRLPLAA
jgi:hypothetical protein